MHILKEFVRSHCISCVKIVFFGVLLAGSAGQSLAVSTELISAFSAGDYKSARDLLLTEEGNVSDSDFKLLNFLVTSDPAQADVLLRTLGKGDEKTDPWQIRWALEVGDEAYARGNFELVLDILKPFDDSGAAKLPGAIFVRAGLACRALKRMQRAREMLASVKPQDPCFSLARYYLGDIALEQGDPELALRYFEGSSENGFGQSVSMSQAGKYEALLALGRNDEAEAMLVGNGKQHGGLSWLNVGAKPDFVPLPEDSVSTALPPVSKARFCLQWAAFSDRALALNFVKHHQDEIPDLRIQTDSPASSTGLFYVRSGSFNNPVEARDRAKTLGAQLNMDVLIKDIK